MQGRFRSFREFYPAYLAEHRSSACRRLHALGSSLVLATLAAAILGREPWLLLALPIAGYGPAWLGHLLFERNRPATFTHPIYSLIGDWVMVWHMLTGRVPW